MKRRAENNIILKALINCNIYIKSASSGSKLNIKRGVKLLFTMSGGDRLHTIKQPLVGEQHDN